MLTSVCHCHFEVALGVRHIFAVLTLFFCKCKSFGHLEWGLTNPSFCICSFPRYFCGVNLIALPLHIISCIFPSPSFNFLSKLWLTFYFLISHRQHFVFELFLSPFLNPLFMTKILLLSGSYHILYPCRIRCIWCELTQYFQYFLFSTNKRFYIFYI